MIIEAFEAARKIRIIAQLAHDAGVSARWFEHAPHAPKGGIPGFLEPVSAHQIGRTCPYYTI